VPERVIGRIKKGQDAYISSDNIPERSFGAVIKRLSPVVDASSGTLKVTVGVSDQNDELRPGMFVSVHIVTETHRNTLLIPKTAVIYEDGMPFSFFVDNDTLARKVRLEQGFSDEEYMEVLASVSDTDRVIVVGQNGLKDGARIKVVAGLLEEDNQIAGDSASVNNKL
jgi:membrane fusion protein, multidrug efflux system